MHMLLLFTIMEKEKIQNHKQTYSTDLHCYLDENKNKRIDSFLLKPQLVS